MKLSETTKQFIKKCAFLLSGGVAVAFTAYEMTQLNMTLLSVWDQVQIISINPDGSGLVRLG